MITCDYNIPSNNRELQLELKDERANMIITYQVITGNYSRFNLCMFPAVIITYQVITGNYSVPMLFYVPDNIITYQVITGNYSI